MQEKGTHSDSHIFPQSKGSKFQPIIPVPKIAKPQPMVQTLTEPTKAELIFLSDRNEVEQLELYKRECSRLINQNQGLHQAYSKIFNEKLELESKLSAFNVQKSETEQKKKRIRRTANQINRSYECPAQRCCKSYGTDASLVQHIKIKHNQYFTSKEFEVFIQNIRHKKNQNPVIDRTPLGLITRFQNI